MKTVVGILIFVLLGLPALSQRTIKGRVVNETTGAPVPGSSVFISNTSKGTTSNSNGNFELDNIPAGKHELVISSIGYETNVFSFSAEDLPLQVKVEMKVKVQELENLVLEPFEDEGWEKWGRLFMNQFVGQSANAKDCRIKNEKAIRFRHYKRSSRLIAYCDDAIVLENKALGYLLKFKMENFEVNFNDQSCTFNGYPLYEPIDKDRKAAQEKWEKKRFAAYQGSIMHFMRSLYENRLQEEGFDVRRMTRTFNFEKQRIKNLYNTVINRKVYPGGVRPVLEYKDGTKLPKDTVSYYEMIMHEKDHVDRYSNYLLSADSLIIDTLKDFKTIHFNDYIYVTYKYEKEEPGYLLTQFPARPAGDQRSYVSLLRDKLIVIDKNGNYFDPQDFFTSAYWGWSEKMANSLPLDYEPGYTK